MTADTTTRVLSGLGRVWRDQLALQMRLLGVAPSELDDAAKMAYITEQALAVNLEVGEALLETGHKSWATSNHVNREAYLAELRDAWQHLINLMLVVDATPGELVALMRSKHKVNHERIDTNYDGVTTKCPQCHRAYDDAAVHCTPAEPFGPGGADELRSWCEVSAKYRHAHPIVDPVNGHSTIAGYKLASDCPGTPHPGHSNKDVLCPLDLEPVEALELRWGHRPSKGLAIYSCVECQVHNMSHAEWQAHLRSADHKRVKDTL